MAGHPTCCINRRRRKVLCFGPKSGELFWEQPSSMTQTLPSEVQSPEEHKLGESFSMPWGSFFLGLSAQICYRSSVHLLMGSCGEAGHCHGGGSCPGRGLCLPLQGSSWLTVNKHPEFAYPDQILPARPLPGAIAIAIAMTTVSTIFMMFARWKSLPQAARCWGEDRKAIQRKVMHHASPTGRADKSYSDHQWLHPDPPHTPQGMISQL